LILAILQARTGESGLPGAAMMPILRTPMIVRQIERMSRSRRVDRLVVLVSGQAEDDALAAVVRREAIAVHRGPPDAEGAALIAVLDAHGGDHVVRMSADCPLADPEAIDAVIDRHLSSGADYTGNTPPGAASPEGQAVEVLSAVALRRRAAETAAPQPGGPGPREPFTWGIRDDPRRWKIAWLPAPAGAATVRWSVERPDDYAFVATVYDHLYPRNRAFTSDDVRAFVRGREDLLTYGGEPRA
jgi:spore coat polysaccharide biosynthesis protein SpsF